MKTKSGIVAVAILFTHVSQGSLFSSNSAAQNEKQWAPPTEIIKKYDLKRQDYCFLISIPKCGTHVLSRILSLMKVKDCAFDAFDWEHNGVVQRRNNSMAAALRRSKQFGDRHALGIYYTPKAGPYPKAMLSRMRKDNGKTRSFDEHWPYTSNAEELFNMCTDANFFIIRDPRDMLISLAYMIHKGPQNGHSNIQDIIFDFIDGRKKNYVPWGNSAHSVYGIMYAFGVTAVYKMYLPWMHARKFITLRFEDLIGDEGGGSSVKQMQEIGRIAKHLKLNLSMQDIQSVRDNIFGKSSTFRAGKIGSWRTHFTPEMKEAYKQVPGACQMLIDLGYEQDASW